MNLQYGLTASQLFASKECGLRISIPHNMGVTTEEY